MKIGIITYHFSDNFGALLQAYALRRWLTERGHDAKFINYHPRYVEQGGSLLLPKSIQNVKSNVKILYLHFANLYRNIVGDSGQRERFEEFRRDVLGVNPPSFDSVEKLRNATLDYDLMIAGSDQIWNPSTHKGLDPAYFLDFGGDQIRKISYAASFGKDTLAAAYHVQARSLIQGLDAISIREQSGVKIGSQLAGREVFCVPDPTLLHSQYNELLGISRDHQEGHIFCYALRTAEGVRKVAEIASSKYKAKIISPYNIHRRWREIGSTVYGGPADWVKQIANARCVVTNSFHGAVFSIIFQKQFIVVGLPGTKAGLNARVINLLDGLGLMDRYLEASNWRQSDELLATAIDWVGASIRLDALRAQGESFLASNLP